MGKIKHRVHLKDLARIASVAAGVQFGWALQLSLLTPYVQVLGISHTFASYIWLCGPITGMIAQPVVGYYSDNCESKWGRRRPFILLGSLLVVIAVLVIGFAADLGFMLGDSLTSRARPRAIVIFVVGFWLLDLANNTLQGPCRALLADYTGRDARRSRKANAFFALFMAVGNVLGFLTGFFDKWPKVFPFTTTAACGLSCANLKSAFLLHVILLVATTIISVTAVKEIQWSPALKGQGNLPTSPLISEKSAANTVNGGGAINGVDAESHKASSSSLLNAQDDEEEEEEEEEVQEAFIWELIGALRDLPRPMWYILAVTALTWVAWFPFLLFDTDWMGRDVYRGEPSSPDPYKSYVYDYGVRMGSLGLMLNAVVLGISSLLIEPACRRLGASYVWGLANLIMTICFALTAAITVAARKSVPDLGGWPPITIAALAVFTVLGVPLAVTYSVPFALTATFTSTTGAGQGLSMGVLNLAVVTPQIIISIGSGPWDALFGGGNNPAFILAAVASFIGAVLAFTLLPRPPPRFHGAQIRRTRSCPIP